MALSISHIVLGKMFPLFFTPLFQSIEVCGHLFEHRFLKLPPQHFTQVAAWTLTVLLQYIDSLFCPYPAPAKQIQIITTVLHSWCQLFALICCGCFSPNVVLCVIRTYLHFGPQGTLSQKSWDLVRYDLQT